MSSHSTNALASVIGQDNKLIPLSAVARELGLTNKTVHNLGRQGRLELVKLGPRSTRVRLSSLRKLITGK